MPGFASMIIEDQEEELADIKNNSIKSSLKRQQSMKRRDKDR